MLSPNQISSHKFYQTKQGFYKAEEVDEYMNLVYQTVCDLYETNKQIQKRISGLTNDLEAYYKDRNSIAAAIIGAQTYANGKIEEADSKADEIIAEASKKAQTLLNEKMNEAEEYFEEKIKQADEKLQKADSALEDALSNANKKAEEYILGINVKASDIINNANEQASKIVSRAFADAKKARETCDNIIENANVALPSISEEISSFKMQLKDTFEAVMHAVDSIDIPDEINIDKTAIDEEEFVLEATPVSEPLTLDESSEEEAEEVVPVVEEDEEVSQIETAEEIAEIEADAEIPVQDTLFEEKAETEELTDLFSNSKENEIESLFNSRFDLEDLFSSSENSNDSED